MIKKSTLFCVLAIAASCSNAVPSSSLRAPSHPLVTIDPYTCIWSPADELTATATEHWTGKTHPLLGVLTVDGEQYRFLGREKNHEFKAVIPGAQEHNWEGKYSTDGGRSWTAGMGAFGPKWRKPLTGTWTDTNDLRVRREVTIPDDITSGYLLVNTIGDAEFYADGVKIAATSGRVINEYLPIDDEVFVRARENGGRIILEGRSRMERKDAFIDMGIYRKVVHTENYPVAAVQTSAQVLPMNTVYTFTCGPVGLELKFTAPLFLDNPDLLSRPVNYISWSVESLDGREHNVSICFKAGRECALDHATDEQAVSSTFSREGIVYAKSSCTDQNPLWRSGDDVRIDWGSFYLAACQDSFTGEAAPEGDIALHSGIGSVRKAAGMIMVGYDDIYSIQYFGQNLRPWWNRNEDSSIEKQFQAAVRDYDILMKKTAAFDAELMERAVKAGGQKYAELCALAYRQSVSAHKLVQSPEGELLWLSKENFSNGSVNTVDVTYPSSPLYFLYNTDLVKGMMNGIFHYSESGLWTEPFPAHDIGTYPIANGQTFIGEMPVEEAGNMLILAYAVCQFDKDPEYARKHWKTLTTWAEYLLESGFDPEDQLCTDDFAGRSAHNVNLSVKAILGIASYGMMADMLGYDEIAGRYTGKAREMAAEWVRMADDGDHYRLCFDRPGTWSMKYNLYWEHLFDMGIFPHSIMEKEIPYYMTKLNEWGLPLDNRENYTKTDWILWTAAMAETQEQFNALADPVWKYYNETQDRVPMTDWVNTTDTGHPGFKARSVVGGIFAKLLISESKY